MNVALKLFPISIVVCLFTPITLHFSLILYSSSFASIRAFANAPAYTGGKSKAGSNHLSAPV